MVETVRAFLALAAVAFLASCATPAGTRPEASVANPVLDADFPDPTVIKAPDGLYYAYATQTQRDGRWVNIQVARSAGLGDSPSFLQTISSRPSAWSAAGIL